MVSAICKDFWFLRVAVRGTQIRKLLFLFIYLRLVVSIYQERPFFFTLRIWGFLILFETLFGKMWGKKWVKLFDVYPMMGCLVG